MSKRKPTWKVIEWADEPLEKGQDVPLQCECGRDAMCPAGVLKGAAIMATIGTYLVLDPPGFVPEKNFMPDSIQCRNCGRIHSKEPINV